MKVHKSYNSLSLILLLLLITELSPAQPGNYYPPPSSISYQTDTLTINPPDSLPGDPVILLGYNIYVDDDFYDNVMVTNPLAPVHFYLNDESLYPGERIFCVDAVYNDWISESTCDTTIVLYGAILPLYEDWSSGSFEMNKWKTTSNNWIIESGDGNPAPMAVFSGDPGITNYEAELESFAYNTQGIYAGQIFLDFDWKLLVNNPSGNEKLRIQVRNIASQNWSYGLILSSNYGNTGWVHQQIDITTEAINTIFKIRFLAYGINSQNIAGWYIDNIRLERRCTTPINLVLEEEAEKNTLSWTDPDYCPECWDGWYRWDDGVNDGLSFGFDDTTEFDVAVRWHALQLPDFDQLSIFDISFFPKLDDAEYAVRIWSGEEPATLVAEQHVSILKKNEWNTIILDEPVEINVQEDLWVGYHVTPLYGFPAGCDNGPAINGYGNWIYYQGEWKTLLEVNPEMNYNWNIACHLYSLPYNENIYFNIYREVVEDESGLYDISYRPQYSDANITLSNSYCYKVSKVRVVIGDTCESGRSDTACEYMYLGKQDLILSNALKIFPNPASDYLNLEFIEYINEVKFYNILGECVLKLEIGNSEAKVDVSGLENGVYFVEVVTGKENYKDKILIFK